MSTVAAVSDHSHSHVARCDWQAIVGAAGPATGAVPAALASPLCMRRPAAGGALQRMHRTLVVRGHRAGRGSVPDSRRMPDGRGGTHLRCTPSMSVVILRVTATFALRQFLAARFLDCSCTLQAIGRRAEQHSTAQHSTAQPHSGSSSMLPGLPLLLWRAAGHARRHSSASPGEHVGG